MIMNIMFNMISEFAHYQGKLTGISKFWKDFGLNINTCLMFNMLSEFAHYLGN